MRNPQDKNVYKKKQKNNNTPNTPVHISFYNPNKDDKLCLKNDGFVWASSGVAAAATSAAVTSVSDLAGTLLTRRLSSSADARAEGSHEF